MEASTVWPEGLPNLGLGYSIRNTGAAHGQVPLVVGFSSPREIHECVRVWRDVQAGTNEDQRKKGEEAVRDIFRRTDFLDWSWASPP